MSGCVFFSSGSLFIAYYTTVEDRKQELTVWVGLHFNSNVRLAISNMCILQLST